MAALKTMIQSDRHPAHSLVSLVIAVAFVASAHGDPIEWRAPSARPTFRKLLVKKDYRDRFDAALKEIGGFAKLKKSRAPVVGFRIDSVLPDSQATRLGIKAGDVLIAIDKKRLWTMRRFGERDSRRRLEYYSKAADANRTVTLRPGKLGIRQSRHYRPELRFARSHDRVPKWADAVLVGIARRFSDPDLAETAWHHAIDGGYQPDRLSDECGACIALAQGRAEVAADFAYPLIEGMAEPEPAAHPMLLYRVALANYKLKQALRLAKQFPGLVFGAEEALPSSIEMHTSRPAAIRSLPAPSQRFKDFYIDDLVPRCVGFIVGTDDVTLPELMRTGQIGLRHPKDDHYQRAILSTPEPVSDVRVTTELKMTPTSRTHGPFGRSIAIGLWDLDLPHGNLTAPYGKILEITLHAAGFVELADGAGFHRIDYRDPTLPEWGTQHHEVRIVRIGGQGEIFLNCKRVLYVPVDPERRNVGIYYRTVGMRGVIASLRIDELIEKP